MNTIIERLQDIFTPGELMEYLDISWEDLLEEDFKELLEERRADIKTLLEDYSE